MLRCDFLAVLIIPFYFKLIFLHEKDLYSCKAFYCFRLICIIITFYFEIVDVQGRTENLGTTEVYLPSIVAVCRQH